MGQEILTGRDLIQQAEKLGVFYQDLLVASGSVNEPELQKRVDKARRDLRDRIWLVAVTFIMIWVMVAFTAWTNIVEKFEERFASVTTSDTVNDKTPEENSKN
ncbi:MAG: hypothetical protein R3D88_06670 [Alphaproteobacteria bacterium]|nr:hypothetical protein [Alphaproteobacteria bacterium]